MNKIILAALILSLCYLVSSCTAPEQKQEAVAPSVSEEPVSALEQISGSWNWIVKAGEANQELWNNVKAGFISEARLQMNAVQVYLDEAEKIIGQAKTTDEGEKCTINAIKQYIAYFRTGLLLDEKLLAMITEVSKVDATSDLADMYSAITAAENEVAGAKTELAKAKAQINAIDLSCVSSDIRVFITVDKKQVADAEAMLETMGDYLSALKKFVECGQTFEKVSPAVEKKNFDSAISLVKQSRELAASAKADFSKLTGSPFAEISTNAVMFKNKIGIFEEGLAKFEEAIVALKSGRTSTAEKLFAEATAKFEAIQ